LDGTLRSQGWRSLLNEAGSAYQHRCKYRLALASDGTHILTTF
jgi:hypothetical protein